MKMFLKNFNAVIVIFALLPKGILTSANMPESEFASVAESEVVIHVTASMVGNIKAGNVVSNPAGATVAPLSSDYGDPFVVTLSGLTPVTSYTFTLSGLEVDIPDPAAQLDTDTLTTPATCTKPAKVSNLEVDAAGTSSSAIKITWENPSDAATGVPTKVAFESYEIEITDAATTEYTFEESAAGTPLTSGQSGKCKVITGVSSGDCSSETNEMEVDCTASDPPTEPPTDAPSGNESFAKQLLPGAPILFSMLYQMFAA